MVNRISGTPDMILFGISMSFRDGAAICWRCHRCGRSSQTGVKYFRYAHLFRLPVLPLGTGQGLVCDHCEHVELGGDLHADLRYRLRANSRGIRRPLWHFSGLLLIAGLILYP